MQYLSLVLSLIKFLTKLIELFQREQWINEAKRRAMAQQIKEVNDALVRAAGVQKEWAALSEEDVRKVMEERGWYSD